MQILEGSDTRVRFKIKEIVDNTKSDLDLTSFDKYVLEIRFYNTDALLEIEGEVQEDSILAFDILGEYTEGQAGNIKADIWGLKGVKQVRFNPSTIKGKVLPSVTVPDDL